MSVQHEGLVLHLCITCASWNYSNWLLKAYSQYKCHQNVGINVLAFYMHVKDKHDHVILAVQ